MEGEGCLRESVVLYWWLALNIGLFYVLIAYGLSLWGAYLCWAQAEEEALAKEALEHMGRKMQAQGAADLEARSPMQPGLQPSNQPLMIKAN